MDRLLQISSRPKGLNTLIGQGKLVCQLENIIKSKRIPHFYIINGQIGSGKTTLARILALSFQVDSFNPSKEDWEKYSTFDILEVNAANENSVDFIRGLVEKMRYKPMNCKAKVVVLDEAHQLTNAAQNALLTETEDTSDYCFYIFCTSNIKKIIPALQRRAYILTPNILSDHDINTLVQGSADLVHYNDSHLPEFINQLIENDIRSPGLILQCAERLFAGNSPQSSVILNQDTNIDTRQLCQCLLKGDWARCAAILQDVSSTEVFKLKSCTIGYIKAVLLKSVGLKAVKLSKVIQQIESSGDNIGSFVSSICISCDLLKVK